MLSALSLFLVQNRNRRNGLRRTFQVAEVLEDGSPNLLYQYDIAKDDLLPKNKSRVFRETLKLYTGMTEKDIDANLANKVKILQWIVKKNIRNVNDIGHVMADYYLNRLVMHD
jgi:hypothetical protein